MGRELLILWVGRRREPWESLCAEYRRRISQHLAIREVVIKPAAMRDERRRAKREGESLLAELPRPSWSIALDRSGETRSSLELSGELSRLLDRWPHPVAFLVGSDVGLDSEVLRRVDQRWSLGPLTFPHALARLVLLEQLYRASSLAAGIRYHRQPL